MRSWVSEILTLLTGSVKCQTKRSCRRAQVDWFIYVVIRGVAATDVCGAGTSCPDWDAQSTCEADAPGH